MKIILKQDVQDLGKAGEITEVKAGYARNYLIPRKFALEASPQNLKTFEHEKKRFAMKELKEKRDAEQFAKQLEKVSLTAAVSVGEEDKVFGAVTSQMIADLLKSKGYEIDRRKIVLEDPIKALGVYDVPIKLHSEVEAKVKLWVVKE
ncbi:MAG: 50S ribosomal protein L9 [bacterium]